MNSVPKTIYQTNAYQHESFLMVQCRYTGGVAMFYAGGVNDSVEGFAGVMAIFRVYPKGQNPMSKVREEQSKRHFCIGAGNGELLTTGKANITVSPIGVQVLGARL